MSMVSKIVKSNGLKITRAIARKNLKQEKGITSETPTA